MKRTAGRNRIVKALSTPESNGKPVPAAARKQKVNPHAGAMILEALVQNNQAQAQANQARTRLDKTLRAFDIVPDEFVQYDSDLHEVTLTPREGA